MSESNRDGKFLKHVVHLTSWWWEMASFIWWEACWWSFNTKPSQNLVSETWKYGNYLTPLPWNPRIGILSCASNTVMWFQKFCDNYIHFINLFYCEQHYTATFQSRLLHKINTFIWGVYIIFYFNWSFDWELVVLHTKLSMTDKFSVHAWSSNDDCSISVHLGSNSFQHLLTCQMSLVLNEVIWIILHSNSTQNSKHAPKTYVTWRVVYAKQPTPNQNSSWITE